KRGRARMVVQASRRPLFAPRSSRAFGLTSGHIKLADLRHRPRAAQRATGTQVKASALPGRARRPHRHKMSEIVGQGPDMAAIDDKTGGTDRLELKKLDGKVRLRDQHSHPDIGDDAGDVIAAAADRLKGVLPHLPHIGESDLDGLGDSGRVPAKIAAKASWQV